MHCRYCSAIYEDGAIGCDGCGAPKSSIGQRVFDATKDKESYSAGFRKLLHRISLFHGFVLVVAFISSGDSSGLSGAPAILTVLWIVPVLPAILANAVWASGRKNLPTLLVNAIVALGVWILFLVTIPIIVNI